MKTTITKKTRAKKVATKTSSCASCPINYIFKSTVIEECIATIQKIMCDTGKKIAHGDIGKWEKFKLELINYEHTNS